MIPLALLCAALIGLIVYLLRHQAAQEREWARERQLLITKIQHPEIVQHVEDYSPSPHVVEEIRPPESDDIDLVGTVQTFDGN